VVVGFGRTCQRGSLPVFTVADEEEARALLVQSCSRTDDGKYFAEELAAEQTLENLRRFSHRLACHHDRLKEAGRCRCSS
jgi:hypothetical protein